MKRVPVVVAISFLMPSPSDVLQASFARVLDEPVAIVCFLSGRAFAKFENKRTELRLFQRLKSGTLVETETGSKFVLAFFTGDRYEFGEKASGTLGRAGIEGKKGAVQKLSPVPAMIAIAPIAKEEKPGTRLAAARIRWAGEAAKSISNLYPSDGAATVAQAALLRFNPVEGYEKYRVEVEDETGNAVFSVETASTTVEISPGVIRPGANYYWRIRTVDAGKPAKRGEALFTTLSEGDARRRAELKAQADETGDPSLLALLAELDRSLGLQWEACEELNAALDQNPRNQPIAEALARFGCTKPAASGEQRK